MPEYIDRENYCENLCHSHNEHCDKESCPIWAAPAADVMEVTRCKDCRHHSAAAGVCNLYLHFSVGVSANDFCSFGERKSG